MPIWCSILEQGEHLLVYKAYDGSRQLAMTGKQEQILKLLVQHGRNIDGPGTITVLATVGYLESDHRRMRVIDPQGDTGWQDCETAHDKQFIAEWFKSKRPWR